MAGISLPPLPFRDRAAKEKGKIGRVTAGRIWVREEPDHRASGVRRFQRDDLVTYFEKIEAEGFNPHNPIWLRVIDGYVYSSYVQPVEIHLNEPRQYIPSAGLLGEISVPYTDARSEPSPDAYRSYRLRYSSVHRIVEAVWGPDGQLWYRLYDNLIPGARRYVPAEHVRPLYPGDLTPTSPHVPDKRIEITLADQRLVAFEEEKPVLTTHISGGLGGARATPRGHHHIGFKAPSRHMAGSDFDLPGVPFDSYFWGGVAIHGTYWHNDYGRPRSHGCVNVPSEVAKWIYRWTMPVVPYDRNGLRVREGGTPVIVS